MIWVIDCSIASALFLPDENSFNADKFFSSLGKKDILTVPVLWWYEFSNVLKVTIRRKRLSHIDAHKTVSLFQAMSIETDFIDAHNVQNLLELSLLYNLSAYDAAYLDLALRKNSRLASLDQQLLDAAAQAGITTNKR